MITIHDIIDGAGYKVTKTEKGLSFISSESEDETIGYIETAAQLMDRTDLFEILDRDVETTPLDSTRTLYTLVLR